MRKIRKITTAVLLMVSMFATSVSAAPSRSQMQEQKNQAEAEIQTLQDELTDLMTTMNVTERKLISKGEEIIEANKQLKVAEENEESQYENMVKRIVAMYENGNSNVFEVVFESGSIAEMLQSMENVQAIHEYDRKELQEYVETKEEISTLKVTLETEQEKLEDLQTDLESQKRKLSNKIESKRDEVTDLQAQIEEAERKAAEEARRQQQEEAEQKGQIVIGGSSTNNYKGSGDPSVGQAIVAAARTYIGVWYLWGGNDYDGIDCSGLTKAAHKAVGINIARWSGDQKAGGKKINSVAEAMPGDIIGYEGHVAIYIGNERVIHAPRTGKQVQEATVYMKTITAIRRYW